MRPMCLRCLGAVCPTCSVSGKQGESHVRDHTRQAESKQICDHKGPGDMCDHGATGRRKFVISKGCETRI